MRIAIVCGGGFSSSALAKHLEKESIEKNLGDRATFIFIPSDFLVKRQDEADIAMVCPHMEFNMRKWAPQFHIPVSIIPPKLYGLMPAEDFIEDAEDLMKIWEENHTNIVTFPDEPKPLSVRRDVSHRRHLLGEKRDYSKK